jgi:predicted aspartyl protease
MLKYLALALVLVTSAAWAEEDCRLELAASLPIAPDRPHRVIVPVELDGKPLNLMVDTGSPVSGLTPAAVERLGLETHYINVHTRISAPLAGGHIGKFVLAKNFKLDQLVSPQVKLVVMPESDRDADGLLGADFMRQFDVDFDFAHDKLNLFRPHRCPGKAVYWTKAEGSIAIVPFHFEEDDTHIHIDLELDGKTVPSILDTGAPRSSISLAIASLWFNVNETTPGVSKCSRERYCYRFKTMTLNGVTVENPELQLRQQTDSHKTNTQGILGLSVLRKLHVFIAYQEHKLYVTSASAP